MTAAADSGKTLGIGIIALAGIFAGGSLGLSRLRRARALRRLQRPVQGAPQELPLSAFRLVEEAAGQACIPREASATPAEYAEQLLQRQPALAPDDVTQVIQALEKRIYAGREVDRTEGISAGKAAERARAVLLGATPK